jgi:hypothetical protein
VQYVTLGVLALVVACGGASDIGDKGNQPPRYKKVVPVASGSSIYDDGLNASYRDESSAIRDLSATAEVHSGTYAVSFRPDRRLALHLSAPSGHTLDDYDTLELWVHGGPGGGQRVRVAIFVGDELSNGVELADYLGGEVPAGTWALARIPLRELGAAGETFHGLWLQGQHAGDQSPMYVDDLSLVRTGEVGVPAARPARPELQRRSGVVQVDPEADRHPVSPLVYGINLGDAPGQAKMRYPVRRWGGNHTSRYAWDNDTSNRAIDWYFENIPEDNAQPEALPHGSSADRFVDETYERGGEPLVTVPMLGWVAKDRQVRWGFSVQKYGAQSGNDCQSGRCDAGNGTKGGGGHVTGNDPHDTSKAVGPDYVVDWKRHIESRTGTAADGGVRFFALDNELTLWPETHRDLHPGKVSYAEIWERTRDYAAALKEQDRDVEIFGPIAWGWCAYHGSSGECAGGPDRTAHGDFIPWYLSQICDYQDAHGVRLVDYLTVHYYPQSGVYRPARETGEVEELRLRAPQSLYDSGYVDESWINQSIELVPRLEKWVADYCPGLKTAITEYNFGGEDTTSGAIAQAEAMAIFGREGLDLATRWTMPKAGTKVEDAFALYRNYDGAGSTVAGDSVRAESFDRGKVPAYAIRDGKQLYVVIFNKEGSARTVSLEVRGGLTGSAQMYGFDQGRRIGERGELRPSGETLAVSLPARSATLVVATVN